MRLKSQRMRLAVFAVIPGAVLLLLAETIAWHLGVEPIAEREAFRTATFMRDCRGAPHVVASLCRPQEPDSRRAVYVFGGSSVQGYPVGETRPFPTYLAHYLEQQLPETFAVHNLGAACRESTYVRKCSARVQGAPNDLYVIYSGHNEFAAYMVPRPWLRMLAIEFPRVAALESWFARSRLYSGVISLVRPPSTASPTPSSARDRLTRRQWTHAHQSALDHYGKNLARVIARAERNGVEIVLATVLSNVSEHPAPRTHWDAWLADHAESPHPWDAAYAEGIALFRAKKRSRALQAFRAAKDLNLWGRAPTALNNRIRELAEANAHVHLVDLERQFSDLWGQRGHGCDFFGTDEWCDQFHPNERLNQFIALRVGERILALRAAQRSR